MRSRPIEDRVPEIQTPVSLAVILVVLAITVVASLVKVRRDPTARAHAGSLRGHPPPQPDQRTLER